MAGHVKDDRQGFLVLMRLDGRGEPWRVRNAGARDAE
jgi:hypothetical protein